MKQTEILAIDRSALDAWTEMAQGRTVTAAELRSEKAQTDLVPGRKSVGDVAVVSLSGFITQKPTLFSLFFGGTSAEEFAAEVVAALGEESIGAVVMDVDSPGGSVFGVPEAAAKIREARGGKPLLAVANPVMASAAYYLASQADEVVATPSAVVGSIGVIAVHVDYSKALEKEGIKVTVLTSGRRKGEGNPTEPLSDEARAEVQERLDYYGGLFVRDVAKGRGVSVEKVRADFGEGAYFAAAKAQTLGLVDRLGTLEETVQVAGRGRAVAPVRAYDPVELRARAVLAGVDWRPEVVAE